MMTAMPDPIPTSGRLVVVGAGGMGRCVLDVVDAINRCATGDRFDVVGVVDDAPRNLELLEARGVPFLGGLGEVDALARDVAYVIGIGDAAGRERLDRRVGRSGRPSPVLVHPNAHVGFGVTMGPGTVVCSHVSIETNVHIGRHVHVNQNSTVGHDSRLRDHTTISPLVAVSGNVETEHAVFVGTGAAIRQGVRVGQGATVAMGAVVLDDVPVGATVAGVPARELAR